MPSADTPDFHFKKGWRDESKQNRSVQKYLSQFIYISLFILYLDWVHTMCFFSFENVGFLIGNKHLLKYFHQSSYYSTKNYSEETDFDVWVNTSSSILRYKETVLRCVSLYQIIISSVCRKCPYYQECQCMREFPLLHYLWSPLQNLSSHPLTAWKCFKFQ